AVRRIASRPPVPKERSPASLSRASPRWRTLTVRAMESPSSADDGPQDRPTTSRDRHASASVNLDLPLHPALAAPRVDVVATGRAAQPDALPKRPLDRLVEALDLVDPQRAGLAQRMDPRAPERLDRIDVPDAGDRTLIEEQRLDRRAGPSAEKLSQPRGREAALERLLPERRVQRHPRSSGLGHRVQGRRVDDRHASEFPGV